MSTPAPSIPRPEIESRDEVEDLSTVPDSMIDGLLLTDPADYLPIKARREKTPSCRRDEVWDGVYVMSPMADYEHQIFAGGFFFAFQLAIGPAGGGSVLPGLNVSDREQGWIKNYRIPDVAVYLQTNPARISRAFARGGPDIAVEILSQNDRARKKIGFYAGIGTRELIFLDRQSWAIELYRLAEGRLDLVGVSKPDDPRFLTSEVLPVSFRLAGGKMRPILQFSTPGDFPLWQF